MKKSSKINLLLLVALGLLWSDVGAAQTASYLSSPSSGSSWVKRCEGPQNQKCEMVQRLMDQQTGARVLEMAVAFPDNKDSARAVLIAPLGVELTQGFSLTIDEQDTMGFQPRYCLSDGCYAFLTLPPDILQMMGKGQMMTLSFYTYDGQPARLPISLEGFRETVQSLKK